MREVIVTGGRDYRNLGKVKEVLDLFDISHLIQGGASGADLIAAGYSTLYPKITSITIQADWTKHGKAAGPIRNREMLMKYPNAIVVAFPGGKGTENCIKQALELGHLVLQVRE